MTHVRVLFCAVFGISVAGSVACSSDHRALEKKPDATVSSSAVTGSGGATVATTAASSGSGAGGTGPVEPDVVTALTFVNGVVDADAASFCFLRHPADAMGELPWPSAAGVPFAHAAKVDLEALGLKGHDIEVKAVVGTAAAIGAKTCAALESAPGVLVRSLAIVPASAFDEPRHLVLVADGCVGGETHTAPQESAVCGMAYAANKPTAGLVAGYLSGLGAVGALRMQFVHAVVGMSSPASIGVAPGIDGAMLDSVATNWTLGAIVPSPPYAAMALADLIDPPKARIAVSSSSGNADVVFAVALSNGAVNGGTLMDGDGLAFVGVGASPGVPNGAWWHAYTYVALHVPKP